MNGRDSASPSRSLHSKSWVGKARTWIKPGYLQERGPHLKTLKSTNSPPTLHYITYTHTHTHTHTHSHTHTPQREQTYRPNPALIVPVADLWLHQLFYLPAALPKLPGLQGEGSHSVSKLGFLFFHLAALDLSCHTWDLVP